MPLFKLEAFPHLPATYTALIRTIRLPGASWHCLRWGQIAMTKEPDIPTTPVVENPVPLCFNVTPELRPDAPLVRGFMQGRNA